MPAFLAPLAAWLLGNPWGRAVLIVLAVLTGGLILRARWVREGRQEAEQQLREEAADARDRIDAVPEPSRSDVDKRLRDGRF